MKFEKEYEEICLTIWGCIPIDIKWAKNTNIYKEQENKIHLKNELWEEVFKYLKSRYTIHPNKSKNE